MTDRRAVTTMLGGLWQLTWLEIKIFMREPLGFIGTVAVPIFIFLFLGGLVGPRLETGSERIREYAYLDIPVLAALMMALSAVLSLITIIAIYRESGILKRLRATPLRPLTILSAQVLVKLVFTAVTVVALVLAGRRYYPVDLVVPWVPFSAALAVSAVSIMSLGFVIASLVPTARFAQPVGTIVLYPMVGMSGLFMARADMPTALRLVSDALPTTHAVTLMKGVLDARPWSELVWPVVGLVAVFAVCTTLSSRIFRWE